MPDGARTDYVLSDVRKFFGHALDFAQRGDQYDAAKAMKEFGGLQTSIVCFTFHDNQARPEVLITHATDRE